jgi:hypothetical protein
LSAVAARLAAARRDSADESHVSQLDGALAGLAEELAAARCEVAALMRENAELSARIDRSHVIPTGVGALATTNP